VSGLFKRPRWKSEQYYIYALVDPRDNLVRYIGITMDVKQRHRQHARRRFTPSVWRWARELENLGMSPVMQVIETVSREADITDDAFKQIVSEREAYWIDEYLRLGTPLFNTFGVTKRYPHSRKEDTLASSSTSIPKKSTASRKWQEKHERVQKEVFSVKGLRSDGYMTLDEISELLDISVAKLRTMVARLDIQPRRFPDDMRKLYYSREDIERIKDAFGMK
jgi:predicted GIY-YIG superfamily endonuclease